MYSEGHAVFLSDSTIWNLERRRSWSNVQSLLVLLDELRFNFCTHFLKKRSWRRNTIFLALCLFSANFSD